MFFHALFVAFVVPHGIHEIHLGNPASRFGRDAEHHCEQAGTEMNLRV